MISGIQPGISDNELENKSIDIINKVNTTKVTSLDIEAGHRLGKKRDTLIKFVNRKDAEQCIDNRSKLANFNRVEPGFDIPILPYTLINT